MHPTTQRADTDTGSFQSGSQPAFAGLSLTQGELAACTFLLLGIPMLLLWTVRPASSPTAGLQIQMQSNPELPIRSTATLNLNQASAQTLELLPGIGPVRAKKIVSWRETHGPFKNVRELEKVPGLSPSLVTRIESLLSVATP